MPIKIAFSTVACPDWTIDEVARRGKEMGYEGVELRTLGKGDSKLASDPAHSDPQKVGKTVRDAGLEPVCLSTSLALHYHSSSAAHQAIWHAREAIEQAGAIGCTYVRLLAYQVETGNDRRSTLLRIAERTKPLADLAAEHNVQILFENAGSFNTSKEWWWLINLIEHPMVGLCWNAANAAAAGEPPIVSVPTLNSRIKMAKVKDTKIGEGVGYLPLGEGNVGIPEFVRRLAGVGFGGYISVEWDRAWLPALAPAEEYLPDAYKRLRGWLDDIKKALDEGLGDASPTSKEIQKLITPKKPAAAKVAPAAAH